MSQPILAVLSERPWAITPDALQQLRALVTREPGALEAARGAQLTEESTVTVRDGVARIPVVGPLFHRGDWFTRYLGFASYEGLALDLRAALDDPAVQAIVLDVDSPGGEVYGCHELAQMLLTSREAASGKRIVAYVSGSACSAAYWLASACDEVIASPTATLGSIGTCVSYLDASRYLEKEGLRRIQLVSSQSPRKNLDPATDAGAAAIQVWLDELAAVFVAGVAQARAVTPETVLAEYGQGGVFAGAGAVAAGLADALGSYEAVVHALAATAATPDHQDLQLVASATAGTPARTAARRPTRQQPSRQQPRSRA